MGWGGSMTTQVTAATTSEYIAKYRANMPAYMQHEVPIINSFRSSYQGALGQKIVNRAIWYMENGYMVYGHSNYVNDGRIDCSNFTSLVYKDFGIPITSASRNYGQVGVRVTGVYSKLQPGSTTKYMLVGVDKLRAGDILTFWKLDSNGNRYIGHVALYMGKIDGKPCIIHTVSNRPTAIGITNSFTWWYGKNFQEARRILPVSSYRVIPKTYQLPPQKPVVMP